MMAMHIVAMLRKSNARYGEVSRRYQTRVRILSSGESPESRFINITRTEEKRTTA